MKSVVTLVCVLLHTSECFLFSNSGKALESFNVDPHQISVSGISSGAAMATQIHVIFSREIMGVGLVAGRSFASCMSAPGLVSVAALEATTSAGAAVGDIDATSNMANDRVYIYNGKLDTTVNPAIGPKIEEFYNHFIPNSTNIKTVFNISSVHAHITDNYGGPCDQPHEENYLNNCNYSAAFDLLNHIYGGNLKKPTATTQQNGQLMAFSQSDFFYGFVANGIYSFSIVDWAQLMAFSQTDFFYVSTPGMYSMDDTGYMYVPSACVNKRTACKLHVAFHGCKMYHKRIGDAYIRHGGYNEVGELNNIIILYPQTVTTTTNPNGCWDWWGYTGALFATQSGFQPTALRRMIHKAAGI